MNYSVKTKPITEAQRALFKEPTIHSQLPVKIGETEWFEYSGDCPNCKALIAEGDLRGRINRFKDVAIILAVGVCWPCKLIIPFEVRIKPDCYEIQGNDEVWYRYPYKPTMKQKVKFYWSLLKNRFLRALRASARDRI